MQQETHEELNIEAIMAEIKQRAAERNFEQIPEFDAFDDDSDTDKTFHPEVLREQANQLVINSELATENPYPEGGGKGFIKKVIRKLNRFWVIPMAAQQTAYNDAAAKGFRQIEYYIAQQQETIARLEKRIKELEDKTGRAEGA